MTEASEAAGRPPRVASGRRGAWIGGLALLAGVLGTVYWTSHATHAVAAKPSASPSVVPPPAHATVFDGTTRVRIVRAPRVAPFAIDGEAAKPVWMGLFDQTPPLELPGGKPAAPGSEARIAWGGDRLYLMLYAADLDLQAHAKEHDGHVELDDSYHLEFSTEGSGARFVFDVSPLGVIADARCEGDVCDRAWESGATVAVDVDGTANQSKDLDEEWALEVAIPLTALGIRPEPEQGIRLFMRRCEVRDPSRKADGLERCASWGPLDTTTVVVLDGRAVEGMATSSRVPTPPPIAKKTVDVH